jgi:uncharacterized membrane protein YvlD (DUF360 family)
MQPNRALLRNPRFYLRTLVTTITAALTLMLLAAVIPDLRIPDFSDAVIIVILLAVLNGLLWPTLIRVTLPITVWTLGLAGIVLNGLMVWAALLLFDDIDVGGIGWAIVIALALTLTTSIVASILGIDDDEFYYRGVIRRIARRNADHTFDDSVPGILFLEIDGLAESVLRRAIRDGNAPALARWLRDGSHRLEGWECDWSSQTSASQAGLLHGSNHDIPAFRWFEKDRGEFVVSNNPGGAAEIERRVSNGRGLLALGGASRGNLVSGDAAHTSFTIASLQLRPTRGSDYYAYFANPYTVMRTLLLTIVDIVRELWQATQQKRRDVYPRVKRGVAYAFLRAVTVIVLRDLSVQTVIADAYAGRPVVYATFVGYDEVAHHSGIERPDALEVLRGIDLSFQRIADAAANAPRPYHVVVLSDHGQSQGPTFLERFGHTLEDVVSRACGESVGALTISTDEGWGHLSAAASELVGKSETLMKATPSARKSGDAVLFGPGHRQAATEAITAPEQEIVVLASGCLGLITLTKTGGRLTLEEIRERWPDLIPQLVTHPGIGFILVRSREHGPVAMGAEGVHYLADGRVEGEDPLEVFGPRAAEHVMRTDGFPHVADIMVNSTYNPMTDEVHAFEELVGSHGGLGGGQSHPFVLFPREFAWPDEPVVSAEQMHRVMMGWLEDLGHTASAANGGASDALVSADR